MRLWGRTFGNNRHLIVLVFMVIATALPGSARSQNPASSATEYPTKPVRVVVGLGAGGATDIQARIFAQKLSQRLGQTFLVDNRVGAGGTVAFDLVAKSSPDGYTLLATANNFTVSPALYRDYIRYDPIKDFAPISLLVDAPLLLVVGPSQPNIKSVEDLLALAKAKPGTMNAASGGVGTSNHLALELFKQVTGANIVHVPYKGGGLAATAVFSGQVDMLFANIVTLLPHVQSGRLRALAVTSRKRSTMLPEVPTMGERGVPPGHENTTWHGWLAPAGTPDAIVARLNAELASILKESDIVKALRGAEPVGSTPQEFKRLIVGELQRWRKLVIETNMRAQ